MTEQDAVAPIYGIEIGMPATQEVDFVCYPGADIGRFSPQLLGTVDNQTVSLLIWQGEAG